MEIKVNKNVSIDLEKLWRFILESRSFNFTQSSFDPSKEITEFDFKFQHKTYDGWKYEDSFHGFYTCAGQEKVWLMGVPAWSMLYSGGMLPLFWGNAELTMETETFLIKMLGLGPANHSLRGLSHYESDGWLYHNKMEGDLSHFCGSEMIIRRGEVVFELNYIGGLIVHQF